MKSKNPSRTVTQVIRLIESSSSIYLATHLRPDGDALGSLLGLALALEGQGKRVARLCASPVPEYYRWLPGADCISSAAPDWPADLGLVLDCDGLSRVDTLQPIFSARPHLIDIDHHSGANAFGEVQWVDPSAAATAELVFQLLKEMGAPITPQIASCLYTALLDDTGRFAYVNTTPRVLRAAAELIELGADPAPIAKQLFFTRSAASVRLLGRALARLQLHHDEQIVSSILNRQDLAETGAAPPDTEGIIDRLRTITGPQVAALFVEQEETKVRVSLRSDGAPQVNRICALFDGGGHPGAAGCTLEGSPEQARDQMIAAVQRALDSPDARAGGVS